MSAATVAHVGEARTFQILGPLVVEVGGTAVRLGGPRQRSVLALLLLNSGQVVPVIRIIDALWEGDPPQAAGTTLRGYVSHLRKALAGSARPVPAGPLVTRPSGYQLDVEPDHVDANRFERLSAAGRRLLQAGKHAEAAAALRTAIGLWRGPALADLSGERWARAHCVRLEDLRQAAIETRVEADLALGRHAEVVSELGALVAEHPLRERLHAHRMLALYRCGRQADALAAYREAYDLLSAQRGIDPGSALRDLESAILRQDHTLDWIPPVSPSPSAAARDEPIGAGAAAAAPAPMPVPVPAELPADVAAFTGRDDPLAELDALLPGSAAGTARSAGGTGGTAAAVVISAIAGAGGVGKTALAVHWGHRVRDRFPDGQLYVNLRGYAPGPPVQPVEALARFLRALGVPAEQVPVDAEEAAGRYRSLLAGRRVLVVLDNAASAGQVRPLLPASAGCLVVVTSRDRLAGLVARDGAFRLALDVLAAEEAAPCCAGSGARSGSRPSRPPPPSWPRCARSAAGVAHRRGPRRPAAGFPLADYAIELRDATGGALRGRGRRSATDVRARSPGPTARSAPPAARLFRLLGLHPGPDFTAEVAAALRRTGRRGGAAARPADGAHLVEAPPGRYALHDLLRPYAASTPARVTPVTTSTRPCAACSTTISTPATQPPSCSTAIATT